MKGKFSDTATWFMIIFLMLLVAVVLFQAMRIAGAGNPFEFWTAVFG